MAGVEGSSPARARPARVLAVDDDAGFLALLCEVVDASTELELVGEADCGERAVLAAEELRPDVVLMDVRMPEVDGIEATRRIVVDETSPRVLVLTTFDLDDIVYDAIAAATRIKASLPSTLVVLVSVTHPDDLRHEAGGCGASAILSKGALRPSLLEDLWRRHVEELPPA
jgi:chemotaxis response regulator CheB